MPHLASFIFFRLEGYDSRASARRAKPRLCIRPTGRLVAPPYIARWSRRFFALRIRGCHHRHLAVLEILLCNKKRLCGCFSRLRWGRWLAPAMRAAAPIGRLPLEAPERLLPPTWLSPLAPRAAPPGAYGTPHASGRGGAPRAPPPRTPPRAALDIAATMIFLLPRTGSGGVIAKPLLDSGCSGVTRYAGRHPGGYPTGDAEPQDFALHADA